MKGKHLLAAIGSLCVVAAGIGYLLRVQSTGFVRNQRALDLVACIDATDRASWNAGIETAQFLGHTMTRGCMATRGYALITNGKFVCAAESASTPDRQACYWRPRTSVWDLLRDDLFVETHHFADTGQPDWMTGLEGSSEILEHDR